MPTNDEKRRQEYNEYKEKKDKETKTKSADVKNNTDSFSEAPRQLP